MGERAARVLNELRAWLGPHSDVVETIRQLQGQRDDARAAAAQSARRWMTARADWEREHAGLLQRVGEMERRERKAQHWLTLAFEPPQGPERSKVRLRDRGEAEQAAAQLGRDVGRPAAAFATYRCDLCPPLTGSRFWHIGNRDPRMRTGRDAERTLRERAPTQAAALQDGRTIGQRVARPVIEQGEVGGG